jgi:DNA-binding PadR family transcriptional regulator
MSLEAAILGFLGEKACSGYDLKTRCFDDAARDFWAADQAQIYRTLGRLQAAKLVRSSLKRQKGKPDRKIYSLTDAGADALDAWLGCAQPLRTPRDAFLMQLYFAVRRSDTDIVELLAARRALHQGRLDDLRTRAAGSARDASTSLRTAALRDAAFDGAISVERAVIDWLDDSIEAIQAGALPHPEHAEDSQRTLFGTTTA